MKRPLKTWEKEKKRNRFPLRNRNQATRNDATNSTSRATTPSIGRKILRTEPLRRSSSTALLWFTPLTEPLRHLCSNCSLLFVLFQTLTYSMIFSFLQRSKFLFSRHMFLNKICSSKCSLSSSTHRDHNFIFLQE